MSTITETCACGASFTAVEHYPSDARKAADEWREGHKHAESVGICGHRPPPLMLGGVEVDRPYCILKAGHAGMHGDEQGAHWTEEPSNEPETAPRTDAEAVPEGHRDAENGVCAAGVGGGEVCMRPAGHDGDHDPDSTEVAE